MQKTVRFVSKNKHKLHEATEILQLAKVGVIALELPISELQTQATDELIKDKALKAFIRVGRPLFVEHTGLYLAHLSGLPGGLTQSFWDTLEADRFAEMFGNTSDTSAVAKTVIGYTDGRQLWFFTGEIRGHISATPRGSRAFQWDCVFIPEGHKQTFAELGAETKNQISMRRHALNEFTSFLQTERR